MPLSIPINFEDEYFEKINFSSVEEVYGKFPADFVGGGRPAVTFSGLSRSKFCHYLQEIKKRKIKFNYLPNSTCMDNKEFSKQGHKEIRKLLDFISEQNIETVTIILPTIAGLVRKYYPQLKINVSTNALVDRYEKVKYWEDEFGVDQITLCHTSTNRDFQEIKRIVKYKRKCELQLICNLFCRRLCAVQGLHGNFQSHASQTHHLKGLLPIDYYCIYCSAKVFLNPNEIIKAGWIRPEDLMIYENLGIHKFKLAERGIYTQILANIVEAYTKRTYKGNFADLVPSDSKYRFVQERNYLHLMKYYFKPSKIKILKMFSIAKRLLNLQQNKVYSEHLGVYVDNTKLDGFINHFVNTSCRDLSCDTCTYCDSWAKKAIIKYPTSEGQLPPEKVFESVIEDMISDESYINKKWINKR